MEYSDGELMFLVSVLADILLTQCTPIVNFFERDELFSNIYFTSMSALVYLNTTIHSLFGEGCH